MTPTIEGARSATEDRWWAAVSRCGEAAGALPRPWAVSRQWAGPKGWLAPEEDKEAAGMSDSKTAVGPRRPCGDRTLGSRDCVMGHTLRRPIF
jgi:hypothetical protein